MTRYAVDGRIYELTSGDRNAASAWAEDLGIRHFDDEFSVQGGRLRTTRVTHYDERVGLEDHLLAVMWQGSNYSLFVPLYSARASDAVRLFQVLRITEHQDGIAVASRDPKRAGIAEPADVAKEIPGIGLLEITALTRTTARRLPAWAGAKVPSGELFRDTLDDDTPYFLLATSSAMVTVLPHESRQATAVANQLGGLRVETVA
ncbi:hypothetical protein [Actinoallomurus rhizosphaericola]|uniref:hypothetical protein n=1 Tax=Actinoallomurus rhizosphaericola TaxID=2952536 RepID=UPI002090537B|nr:hypothetical protein [Actinoallomurus rhizosphaericola]MCO5993542.1 hypothetical protein [Actinoallomurus rhizosphaericola]